MKEFLVGLLVILMMGVFSVLGILLFPLFLVMGFFLRFLLGLALFILVIWVIGKVTLVSIDHLRKR